MTVIELLRKVKKGEMSCEDAHIELLNLFNSNKSMLTLDEGKKMVDFGFWYATESMHDGNVPVGNYLQRLMYVKGLVETPKEWDDYKRKNGYDC